MTFIDWVAPTGAVFVFDRAERLQGYKATIKSVTKSWCRKFFCLIFITKAKRGKYLLHIYYTFITT